MLFGQTRVGGWGGYGRALLDRLAGAVHETARCGVQMVVGDVLRNACQTGEAHLGIIDIWMTSIVLKATGTDSPSRKKERGAQVRHANPDI